MHFQKLRRESAMARDQTPVTAFIDCLCVYSNPHASVSSMSTCPLNVHVYNIIVVNTDAVNMIQHIYIVARPYMQTVLRTAKNGLTS